MTIHRVVRNPHGGWGERVRTIRRQGSMSIIALSGVTRLAKGHLSNIENGHVSNPGIDVVAKIAKALGVSIDDLYYGASKDEA